jgi:lycopene beta-cyclase
VQAGHSPAPRKEPSVGQRAETVAPVALTPDEYVLVGGGLQNALVVLALLEHRPDARLTVIEREPSLGGNHTWCFHAHDVPEAARGWLDALVVKRWPAHDVLFPGHRRRLNDQYNAVTSQRLHQVVSERLRSAPGARLVTASVRDVEKRRVTLEDGSQLHAELVIDARGPGHGARAAAGGYQKFLGLELSVAKGSVPEVPILMDATVPQLDGFRFMYVLPWADDRVLVEDTYYSTSPHLDREALAERILEYAGQLGMRSEGVLREESGVLPIPTRHAAPPASTGAIRAGYGGGLFHPTTGYSLPVALRFALYIATRPAAGAQGADYARWLGEHRRQQRFCVGLNRLLFDAFAPEQRHHVLERFYHLPVETIRRFYALETTATDRARILCGRPPSGFSLRRLIAGGQHS